MRAALIQPPATEPSPPLWEQAAAAFVITMLTGAIVGPVFAPDQGETPILRLVWLPVYAVTAGLLAWRFDRVVRAWPAWIGLGALVVLAWASQYWSIESSTTSRRVIAMALTGSFGIYLGAAFRGSALPRLLALTALALGLGSLVAIFLFPSLGVHQDVNAGLWRGLWYEKNQMGVVMVAGAIGAAAWLASEEPRKGLAALALVVCILLMLGTRSKTSLLCLMAGLGLVGGFWAIRKGGPAFGVVAVWLGVIGLAAGWWLWTSESAEILELLGKDPSLTGRTDIWASLMRRVGERSLTGYGYGAFWGAHSTPAAWVRHETGWIVPSAHNGWIDLLVQLGWSGAVIVGTIMAAAFVGTLFRLPRQGAREGYWSISYFAAFFLLSLSESVLVSHQDIAWILCLAIFTRAVQHEDVFVSVPLAPKARAAYQTGPRIAANWADGRSLLHNRRR